MSMTFATNMKCQSCLSKVSPVLDDAEVVSAWEADLAHPDKLIRIEESSDATQQQVAALIESADFTAKPIEEAVAAGDSAEATDSTGFRLATYKPLLLVVAYISGATLIVEAAHGGFRWPRAMSYFMGFFFLGFAFFKLLDVSKFADAFSTYDVVAKRSRQYALAYPWVELTLGSLFVTRATPVLASIVTFVIMLVGLVGVIGAVRSGRKVQCACLGTTFNLPMSVVTIIENTAMAGMAATMLWYRLG